LSVKVGGKLEGFFVLTKLDIIYGNILLLILLSIQKKIHVNRRGKENHTQGEEKEQTHSANQSK